MNGAGKASAALLFGAFAAGFAADGCSDTPAAPGQQPLACVSSLSPKTKTICTGTSVLLNVSDPPATGNGIEWTCDVGVIASSSQYSAVFLAPSSGSGTARIRVRWPSACEFTSYIAYEPCDGGSDGAADGADGCTDGSTADGAAADVATDAP
jgi:hypothetical protein